jgi:hypothetical protein
MRVFAFRREHLIVIFILKTTSLEAELTNTFTLLVE